MLSGKKILIGISGSIAAYKIILLIRLLSKANAEVKVIMTESAKQFVSPLVLSTLTKHEVLSDLSDGAAWANHVMLGRWADIMLIAPLSCNSMAKMAYGHCDNLLLAVYLSATCKVMAAPAMDEDMWHHPATQNNLKTLKNHGVHLLEVGNGLLASGLSGEGRMAEPEDIFNALKNELLTSAVVAKTLLGKKALVTAGPTYEPIDPVRFIGNHSSGKMGIAVAEALHHQGAEVTLILGPSSQEVPNAINCIRVSTAQEMFDAATLLFKDVDIAVMAAAVADYRPSKPFSSKYKKQRHEVPPAIELIQNPDILKHCGIHKSPHQTVVGFALETDNEEQNALKKLADKKSNILVLNSLKNKGAGFGTDTNQITIFNDRGERLQTQLISKVDAAKVVVDSIIKYISG